MGAPTWIPPTMRAPSSGVYFVGRPIFFGRPRLRFFAGFGAWLVSSIWALSLPVFHVERRSWSSWERSGSYFFVSAVLFPAEV
jgi:hypothetical protein